MATNFLIRTSKKSGRASIIARVRRPEINLDIKLSTNLDTDIKRWNDSKENAVSAKNFRRDEPELFAKLDELEKALDLASKGGITQQEARSVIDRIVYREAREEQKALEAARMKQSQANSFIEYYSRFVEDAKAGKAVKIGRGKGGALGDRTAINYAQGLVWLKEYQEKRLGGRGISFSDINQGLFNDYRDYLQERELQAGQYKGETGCKQNTISMRLAELKSVLKRAERDGEPVPTNYAAIETMDDVEVDSIALTRAEIDAIMKVDLSELPKCYDQARDIFLVGVWTAQRVSDYDNIKEEDIRTQVIQTPVKKRGKWVVETSTVNYITIRQKKTKNTVYIPINSPLQAILDKYDCKLPFLWPTKLNDYIKEICRRAGMTQKERVVTVRGGKEFTEYVERCQLVHTHTARRTGATLMYNEGVDLLDIMRITGHSSTETLKRYIRATGAETAYRIGNKYAFFQ